MAVTYAETAVRLLDIDVRDLAVDEAFPQAQLDAAKECLQDARERERERTKDGDKGKAERCSS